VWARLPKHWAKLHGRRAHRRPIAGNPAALPLAARPRARSAVCSPIPRRTRHLMLLDLARMTSGACPRRQRARVAISLLERYRRRHAHGGVSCTGSSHPQRDALRSVRPRLSGRHTGGVRAKVRAMPIIDSSSPVFAAVWRALCVATSCPRRHGHASTILAPWSSGSMSTATRPAPGIVATACRNKKKKKKQRKPSTKVLAKRFLVPHWSSPGMFFLSRACLRSTTTDSFTYNLVGGAAKTATGFLVLR